MEAGQTCTGTGALVAQARGCQATAKRIWLLSLLPGVEEPQDSIFTRCHLRRRFCSGRFWTAGRDSVLHGASGAPCPGVIEATAMGPWRGKALSPMLSGPGLSVLSGEGPAKFSQWLRAGGPDAVMVKLQAPGLLLGPKQHKGLPMFSASLGSPFQAFLGGKRPQAEPPWMVLRVTPGPEVPLPRPQFPYKCPGILGAWLSPEMLGDAGESLWVSGEMLVVGEAEPETSSPGRPSTTLGLDPARLPQGEG